MYKKILTLDGLDNYNSYLPYKKDNKNNIMSQNNKVLGNDNNVLGNNNLIEFATDADGANSSQNIIIGSDNEIKIKILETTSDTLSNNIILGNSNYCNTKNSILMGNDLEVSINEGDGLFVGDKDGYLSFIKNKINFNDKQSINRDSGKLSIVHSKGFQTSFKSATIYDPQQARFRIEGNIANKAINPAGEECYKCINYANQNINIGTTISGRLPFLHDSNYILMQALNLQCWFYTTEDDEFSYSAHIESPLSDTGFPPVGEVTFDKEFFAYYENPYVLATADLIFYYWIENDSLVVAIPANLYKFLSRCATGNGVPAHEEKYSLLRWGIRDKDNSNSEINLEKINWQGLIFQIEQINLLSWETSFNLQEEENK